MLILRLSLLLTSFNWLIIGCGVSDEPLKQSVVDGNWQSDCNTFINQDSQNISQRQMLTFKNGNEIAWQKIVFRDGDCAESNFELSYQGTYELIVTTVANQFQLDFFQDLTLARLTNGNNLAPENKLARSCGLIAVEAEAQYRMQELKPETDCPFVTREGFFHQNLLSVKDDTLIFATDLNTSGKRPITIEDDSSIAYVRVEAK